MKISQEDYMRPMERPRVPEDDENVNRNGSGWGVRHSQVAMLFFGLILAYMMRVNMSVGIVAMTTIRSDNATNSTIQTFDWNHQVQAVLLSSFFWGYIVLQIPAGALASRYGAKTMVGMCVAVNGGLSFLLPIAAYRYDWIGVCVCRILQGLAQGFLYPCVHCLLGKWAPPGEKSRLCAIVYAGAQLGTAIEMILAGILAESRWGWPSIFYSVGVLSIAWAGFWWNFGGDSPQTTWYISETEKAYIQKSLGQVVDKRHATPWKAILTSLPFWALVVAHNGQNWGFWTLLTETPSYLNRVLGVDIKSNGMLSALPYLAQFLMSFPVGILSDLAIKKKWCKITTSRKIFNTIGQWGPAIALIGLAYAPVGNIAVAVACLVLTVGINAGHYSGYLVVHIDMAPNFAGILMGFTNCFANLVSIIAPLTVGLIIDDESNPYEWRKIFFISSAVYFFCNLFFIMYGTSEKQPWNEPKADVEEEVKHSDEKPVRVTEC